MKSGGINGLSRDIQSDCISLNSIVNMSCAMIDCRGKNLGLKSITGLVRVKNADKLGLVPPLKLKKIILIYR